MEGSPQEEKPSGKDISGEVQPTETNEEDENLNYKILKDFDFDTLSGE